MTIDFNADIPWEELLEIEAQANQYIYEDHPIDIQFHRGAELDAIDYRSKKPLEGDVRIVTFPGADCCACCGTHVLRSGQVGLVKFLSVQKFREGVRIELLCGKRALEYLSKTWEQAKAIGQRLSVKPVDSEAAVERLEGELAKTAVYDVPVGEVWSRESIAKLKKQTEDAGLHFEVIESIPVHEDIKLGKPSRDKYIENYCENIRRVAEAGIKCVCYNFMPVFDWTRTQLDHPLPDGSTSLVYYQEQVDQVNPLESDSDLTLPGWDASYSREELKDIVAQYQELSEDDLWNNLQYFLEKIIPVAAECDVNMAIHEDDPCWSIFGLPRIITCEENLDRFLSLVDDPHNGITLCTGSLGCSAKNDVVKMAAKYAKMGRIHFAHLRNVQVLDNGFEERAHLSSCGSLDMYAIVKALHDNGFTGYVRPDHGRMIWGETGRAGYGLYDRALGATYINGLFEAVEKADKNN